MLADIMAKELHHRRRRLSGKKSSVRAAGGIVDHHHEHTPLAASFKPVVMAPIHLHHLTQTGASLPPAAVNPMPMTPSPQSFLQKPTPQGLSPHREAIFTQLLRGQRRTETGITLAITLQHRTLERCLGRSIPRPATQLVNQSRIAMNLISLPDPPHLPNTQMQQRCSFA